MSATIVDAENIKPQDNVPQLAGVIKSVEQPLAAAAEPVKEVIEDAAEEEEEVEEEDDEYVDEDDYEEEEEEDNEEEDEGEEIYPEDELSIEVDAPASNEEEAKEAMELAKALGLETPESALDRLGQQEKRVSVTINKYSELISSEKECQQLYDGLTSEINSLRTSVDQGLNKIVSSTEIPSTNEAIGMCYSILFKLQYFIHY